MNEAALIFGMFVATFSVRYLLFAVAGRVHFPSWLSTALAFVPSAVLTAIIVPAVLMPKGELWLSMQNPWLLAAFAAAVIALIRKDLLTTIVGGMLVFVGLKFGLGLG
ncbi:Branched-chain amino acid transport protein [Oceanospirillum multiglobuliferum]|uniref:Branched-chain amino acid transport n=1 Tax=Oceanospirillum multiglobuliferum TaxID=64969 RepID=A0A1T4PNN5_9GAMM|nr:AzlD domain-containing protein [Oceanospirillum multiglobuliferum]OPX55394.1 branched-chain amino acid transport [Oceanospirillum multiglobuliferum]SJZ93190.1 Branched-chain amino acid transport protein [Oceanospirillum multiglobuliferum]